MSIVINKGLGFSTELPSTLNVVNKARVIISSQINSSVRMRFNKLEKEVETGARTPDELKEYYFSILDFIIHSLLTLIPLSSIILKDTIFSPVKLVSSSERVNTFKFHK